MSDMIIVGCIVTAAVAFLAYRYFFKKSGGCSCGCGTCHASKKPAGGCDGHK